MIRINRILKDYHSVSKVNSNLKIQKNQKVNKIFNHLQILNINKFNRFVK